MNYDLLVNEFLVKKILLVTSFNEKIYNFSGKNLINSFFTFCNDSNIDFLITYEDFDLNIDNKNIFLENVMTKYLKNILNKNKDIIPECYGGTATKENNPELFANMFNFQAARWFRKMAALEIAYSKYRNNYEYIIWIDSDCIFLSKFNYNTLIKPLDNNIFGYYYGPKRLAKNFGIETGLVFINKLAYYVLKEWVNILNDTNFRKIYRWDDGYLLKYLLIDKNYHKDNFIDFSHKINTNNPINYGPYIKIIKHLKGSHQRNNIIIKN